MGGRANSFRINSARGRDEATGERFESVFGPEGRTVRGIRPTMPMLSGTIVVGLTVQVASNLFRIGLRLPHAGVNRAHRQRSEGGRRETYFGSLARVASPAALRRGCYEARGGQLVSRRAEGHAHGQRRTLRSGQVHRRILGPRHRGNPPCHPRGPARPSSASTTAGRT
jgi:hypothetical protein